MDFDSIITFLFIIAFFVLPSILKQVKARKKKTTEPSKPPRKKPSLFGKIGERIRQFIQELEEQAKQQKKETREQETVWENLVEEEDSLPVFESAGEDADFSGLESKKIEQPLKKRVQYRKPGQETCNKEPVLSLQEKYRFKSNSLQNAIIWSEILSKPLALRDK